jgi:uncharacterized repeat protein (TIGR01451 family)
LNATITYQGGTNNDVILTVTAAGSSDLTVTKYAPGSVPGGSDFTYKIKVSNSASATGTATGVSVTDQLPAGVSFVSSTPECSESAGMVTCTGLPDIPAGGSKVVKIVVTAGSAPAPCRIPRRRRRRMIQLTALKQHHVDLIITCITESSTAPETVVTSTGDAFAKPGRPMACAPAGGDRRSERTQRRLRISPSSSLSRMTIPTRPCLLQGRWFRTYQRRAHIA